MNFGTVLSSPKSGILDIFSWEPALWTLNKVTGSGDEEAEVKKSIAIFGYKQWLLSLDMKTKIVQHVSRINLSHFKFWILNLNFKILKFSIFFWFPAFVWLSDIFKQHTWTHQKYKSVRIRQRPHDCLNVWLLHNCTNVYIIVRMLTYKKVPMSTKRSLILQKVQLLHNCTSVYIIVPMLTYKKIHFVYKKDTPGLCHPLYERPIWRRHAAPVWFLAGNQLYEL